MKRSVLLLSFFILGSCGKYQYQGEFIGKTLSEVKIDAYTKTDSDSLVLACSALATKESSLNSEIFSEARLNFNVRVSNCSGQFVDSQQTVKIERDGENFIFKQTNGFESFVFKNVETPKVGILAKVCQSISSFNGQYEEGDKLVIVRTGENGTECPRSQDGVCLQVIKAQKDTQKITSRELVRIRHGVNRQYRGFFDWRRLTGSSIDCSENQYTTIEAVLSN